MHHLLLGFVIKTPREKFAISLTRTIASAMNIGRLTFELQVNGVNETSALAVKASTKIAPPPEPRPRAQQDGDARAGPLNFRCLPANPSASKKVVLLTQIGRAS